MVIEIPYRFLKILSAREFIYIYYVVNSGSRMYFPFLFELYLMKCISCSKGYSTADRIHFNSGSHYGTVPQFTQRVYGTPMNPLCKLKYSNVGFDSVRNPMKEFVVLL